MSVALEVIQVDMLGNDTNELHSLKMQLMLTTPEVSHLDISGKDVNNLQS